MSDEAVFPPWPAIPLEEWADTCDTLHLWTQVVGKVRLMQAPLVNHWWDVALHVTSRGLTTSPIAHGERTFEIRFDFVDHRLDVEASDGRSERFLLEPRSVADFHEELRECLRKLDLRVPIRSRPVEVEDAIPFEEDREHASYDPDSARRFWTALSQADRLLKRFRPTFLGKTSPVHFFWGSFDLAMTRFSGRAAPEHPGGIPNMPDWATREAYSHEVYSAGFWPGKGLGEAAFYAYAHPQPDGLAEVDLTTGYHHGELGEFVLPWETVRASDDPDRVVLEFLEETWDAVADLGGWDRSSLERAPGELDELAERLALPE